MLADYIYIYLP